MKMVTFEIVGMKSFPIDMVNVDFDTVNLDWSQPTNCNRNLGIWVVYIDRSRVAIYFY